MASIEEVDRREIQEYLSGYRYCVEMLQLRQYERVHPSPFPDPVDEVLLSGNEAFWKSRMMEIGLLISSLPNGRAKLVLHYRYIKGLSVERVSDLLGVSRRTGYRLHDKGLFLASIAYKKRKSKV
ncbi:MAG: sigma-70 family RNA polymerase sigma factor [Clostridia bacterium]|nr:sigma-70 family RNA polymerase sigma factor [Clostridia bacterium]